MVFRTTTDLALFSSIAAYLRHSTLTKGRFRWATRGRALGRRVASHLGQRRVVTKHGFAMDLALDDWIPQEIFLTGEFEPATTAVIKRVLNPGDVAVDVGANIGYSSLLFAKCVGPDGHVFSHEPVPALATRLRRNTEINGYNQVTLSNLALSDHAGKATFYTGPADNAGLSSLRQPRDSSGTLEVTLARFDEIFDGAQHVALVKIDVEGAELAVLRGMEASLRRERPNLLVELTDKFLKEMGDDEQTLLAYLQGLGYYCYLIGDNRIDLVVNRQAPLPSQWNGFFSVEKIFGDGMALR